jgi:hypothetical protein
MNLNGCFLILCALLLGGCANRPGLYEWGQYDTLLYESYKSPEKSATLRVGLEEHIAKTEQAQKKVAPGLYAELGTLYLQAGDSAKAIAFYTKERNAWPESSQLMNSLITQVGKRTKESTGVKS